MVQLVSHKTIPILDTEVIEFRSLNKLVDEECTFYYSKHLQSVSEQLQQMEYVSLTKCSALLFDKDLYRVLEDFEPITKENFFKFKLLSKNFPYFKIYGIPTNTKTFDLCVRTLAGKTISIEEVSCFTTIDQLKLKIHEKEGIPIDHQRLVYAGKQLEDGHILKEYSLDDTVVEPEIHLVLRLRGGMLHESSGNLDFLPVRGEVFDIIRIPLYTNGKYTVEILPKSINQRNFTELTSRFHVEEIVQENVSAADDEDEEEEEDSDDDFAEEDDENDEDYVDSDYN